MATAELDRSPALHATTVLWFLATGISAVRVGTLLGLFPRLLQSEGTRGAVLVLLLHVGGAVATLAAVFVHSRIGLLLAVLYTGYSMVVLALGAPTPGLQTLTWSVGGLTFVAILACAASPKGLQQRRTLGVAAVALTAIAVAAGVALLLMLR